jgi:hypothetical protein
MLLCLVILGGQRLTRQAEPVIRLGPHNSMITADSGGYMVQLMNAPKVIALPDPIPTVDKAGNPWAVDAKNLGPESVHIVGKPAFSVLVNVGQTVHIHSDGVTYSLER